MQDGTFEFLFALDLVYRGPIEFAPIGGDDAKLVGGGDGTVDGPAIRGTVQWSNHETTDNDLICNLHVPGIIVTRDGEEIRFEGREYAMPLADGGKQWKIAGVMRFKTEAPCYRWLNETFALTHGMFDQDAGRAHWHAYVPRAMARSSDDPGRTP